MLYSKRNPRLNANRPLERLSWTKKEKSAGRRRVVPLPALVGAGVDLEASEIIAEIIRIPGGIVRPVGNVGIRPVPVVVMFILLEFGPGFQFVVESENAVFVSHDRSSLRISRLE